MTNIKWRGVGVWTWCTGCGFCGHRFRWNFPPRSSTATDITQLQPQRKNVWFK